MRGRDNVPDPGHSWQAGGSLPSVPQPARGTRQTYRYPTKGDKENTCPPSSDILANV